MNKGTNIYRNIIRIGDLAKKALEYLCDYKRCMLSVGCANAHLKLGGFQLLDLIITELKSHMTF